MKIKKKYFGKNNSVHYNSYHYPVIYRQALFKIIYNCTLRVDSLHHGIFCHN